MKITHKTDYAAKRRKEYPDWREFAEAIYLTQKGDSTALAAWTAKIDDVKRRIPKPKK